MKKQKSIASTLRLALSSNTFFWLVIGLFLLQAGWLAVSASFPMLYDEYFHLSYIDMFSDQYSPVISSQSPEELARFSDLTRNPQLLYHYILSYPYRAIASTIDSFYVSVTLLRIINVIMVAGGLIGYKKLFDRVLHRPIVSNLTVLFLTLLPVFIFVSAHINYDNLVFLITPILLLKVIELLDKKSIDSRKLLAILSLMIFGILIKLSFAVISLVCLIFIVYNSVKKRQKLKTKSLSGSIKIYTLIPYIFIFLLLSTMIFERYIINAIQYRSIVPSCIAVHDNEACERFRYTRRATEAKTAFDLSDRTPENIVIYTKDIWLPFIVEGATIVGTQYSFEDLDTQVAYSKTVRTGANPLSLISTYMWIFLALSILFIAYSFRELLATKHFRLLSITFIAVTLTLLVYYNYSSYVRLGQAFAVQLRYLLIVMPIFVYYAIFGFSIAVKRPVYKVAAFSFFIFIMSQGGGILAYIVSSDYNWYWQRETIVDINLYIKDKVEPYILNSDGVTEGFNVE